MISNVPWSGSRQGTGSPASELSWHRHLTLDLAAVVLTTVQRYRYPSPLGSAKPPESADVPVEACRLKLAHDHADMLLAEVLFAVTGLMATPDSWRKRRWLVALAPSSAKL